MYWQEDDDSKQPDRPFSGVVDLNFRVDCRTIPVDHAWELSTALCDVLPWLGEDDHAGIHLIHVTEYGNGWQRPDGEDAVVHLPKRARLSLRMASHRVPEASATLAGRTLPVGDPGLTIGQASVRLLQPLPTLQSRYLPCAPDTSEDEFVEDTVARLRDLDITVRKLLCGRQHRFSTPDGPLHLRSLMLADLSKEDSLRLQSEGLGDLQHLGCGLFIPHKGIEPVSRPKGA